MQRNPNCDGGHCTLDHGEVKTYPLGGGANLILCQACWAHENRYRWKRAYDHNGNGKLDIAGSEGEKLWPQQNWYDAKSYPEG